MDGPAEARRLLNLWFESHPRASNAAVGRLAGIKGQAIHALRAGKIGPSKRTAKVLEVVTDVPASLWFDAGEEVLEAELVARAREARFQFDEEQPPPSPQAA